MNVEFCRSQIIRTSLDNTEHRFKKKKKKKDTVVMIVHSADIIKPDYKQVLV